MAAEDEYAQKIKSLKENYGAEKRNLIMEYEDKVK